MIDIKLTPVHNYILSLFIDKNIVNFTEQKILRTSKRYNITRETFLKSLRFLEKVGAIKRVSSQKCHKYQLQIPFNELQKKLGLTYLLPTETDFNIQNTEIF